MLKQSNNFTAALVAAAANAMHGIVRDAVGTGGGLAQFRRSPELKNHANSGLKKIAS
jgi:hypothetical protein